MHVDITIGKTVNDFQHCSIAYSVFQRLNISEINCCSGQCGVGTTQRVMSMKLVTGLVGKNVVKLSAGNGCEHMAALTG